MVRFISQPEGCGYQDNINFKTQPFNLVLTGFGKILILFGVILIVVGVVLLLVGKVPFLGRLPGDIHIQKKGFDLYFPLGTCILLSVVISLIIFLINVFSKK